MKLPKAKQLLEEVEEKKTSIPYRHYKKEVPHKGHQGFHAGRYPVKAANSIRRLLEELEANARLRLQLALRVEEASVDGTGFSSIADPEAPVVFSGTRSFVPLSGGLGALYDLSRS